MKNWKFPLALLLLLPALWLACTKNDVTPDGPNVTVTFAGQVLDENNQPLAGADVHVGIASAVTDANGVFRLQPVQQPARNAILSVHRQDYFDFSRAYVVGNNALQTVRIQLLKKQLVHSFMTAQSTTAQVGAVQIRFPANSVGLAGGGEYSGIVSVYARYLDPSDPDLRLRMPGDLRGISTGGAEQTLATFGMIGVELSTPGGTPLQIAAGKEVEITLPIPAGKSAVAPAEIPLWHYDVESARWIEEGTAQKVGNQYVGKVKHFSFWNCDVGLPLIHLGGHIFIDNPQNPAQLATVKLTVLSQGWEGYGPTYSNGYFGGLVPANEIMKMEVQQLDQCGQWITLSTQTIGPFSTDATLPDEIVTLPNIPSTVISGRLVDCNQQPVTNGYVALGLAPYFWQTIFTDNSGEFKHTVLLCNSNPIELTGYDLNGLATSGPLSFSITGSALQLGDIAVCTTPDEYFEITVDGKKYTFIAGFEGLTDGSRTSIYGWTPDQSTVYAGFQNNGQTGTFPLLYFQLYPGFDTLSAINMSTQLTQFGTKGQPFSGTINGTIKTQTGQTKTVSGKYKILRDN